MLILAIYFRPPVSLVRSLSLTVFLSQAHFTMVTPANVLVPHYLTFYPPPSPRAIRLSISHTGITLIMIIAVMVMITTAKLHPLSLIFNTQGDYDWLKGCLQMFPSPRFVQPRSICLCFFRLFQFIWLFHTPPAMGTRCSLSVLLTSCHFSVFSILQQSFIFVVVLFSTSPGPSYLRHLSSALLLSQSCFSPTSASVPLSTLLLCRLLILQLQRNKIN